MDFINIYELETIIENIIGRVNCPKCDASYTPEDLSIVGTKAEKCMIAGLCHCCSCPMAITVNISRANQQMEGEISVPEEQLVDTITEKSAYSSENPEMSSFLESFDGNFEQLFNES